MTFKEWLTGFCKAEITSVREEDTFCRLLMGEEELPSLPRTNAVGGVLQDSLFISSCSLSSLSTIQQGGVSSLVTEARWVCRKAKLQVCSGSRTPSLYLGPACVCWVIEVVAWIVGQVLTGTIKLIAEFHCCLPYTVLSVLANQPPSHSLDSVIWLYSQILLPIPYLDIPFHGAL